MLPTINNNQNALWLENNNYLLSNHFLIKQHGIGIFYHLYFISDDEIKKDDWFIDDKYKQPMKYFGEGSLLISSKKIIATTDKSLTTKQKLEITDGDIDNIIGKTLLPQPSQEWIKWFVGKYNDSGKAIDYIDVEYEEYFDQNAEKGDDWGHQSIKNKLKINSDNTINIKSIKDSWNREEHINSLKLLGKTIIENYKNGGRISEADINMWINENL